MTSDPNDAAALIALKVRQSGLTIYDLVETNAPTLYYDVPLLEARLRTELMGKVLAGAIRTRSLVAKRAVAEALGYPAPRSFVKVRPRFPGQKLDVVVQTADNYQIWNEEVDPLRRYAFLRPNGEGTIVAVRVVTGEVIAALDTTGTLTSKYQASRLGNRTGSRLVQAVDTDRITPLLGSATPGVSIANLPLAGSVLPISEIYRRLSSLIGTEIPDPGKEQDRLRGEGLQRAAADALKAGTYANVGQWPDIRSQALEVKLQMARTIDLGLVLPSSAAPAEMLGSALRHCDVRYAIFYGTSTGQTTVQLDAVVVTTGEGFFDEFQLFGGLEVNRKLQIKLPNDFFKPE